MYAHLERFAVLTFWRNISSIVILGQQLWLQYHFTSGCFGKIASGLPIERTGCFATDLAPLLCWWRQMNTPPFNPCHLHPLTQRILLVTWTLLKLQVTVLQLVGVGHETLQCAWGDCKGQNEGLRAMLVSWKDKTLFKTAHLQDGYSYCKRLTKDAFK